MLGDGVRVDCEGIAPRDRRRHDGAGDSTGEIGEEHRGGRANSYLRESALGEDTADELVFDGWMGMVTAKGGGLCQMPTSSLGWAGLAAGERGTPTGVLQANSHQQAGFTAGTVANDDELSADLSHSVCFGGDGDGDGVVSGRRRERCRGCVGLRDGTRAAAAGRWGMGWRRRRKVGRGKRTSEGGLVWFRVR